MSSAALTTMTSIRRMAPIVCTIIINKFRSTRNSAEHPGDRKPEEDDEDEDEDENDDYCVICQSEVIRGEEESWRHQKEGYCKQGFHLQCIHAWLLLHNNSSCPLCRQPLPSSSLKKMKMLMMMKNVNIEEDYHRRHPILSCFLAFLQHFWRWFLNPLGFAVDDHHHPASCHHQHPNYYIC